jgi:beta-barrel assembly-enhancing protease
MKKGLTLLLLFVLPGMFSGCKTVDLGNISQHLSTATTVVEATSKAARPISDEEEYYVGRAVAAKILGTYRLSKNWELTRYVILIGKTVAMNSDKPTTFGGYHFAVLDTDEMNAFACPGGTIFITKGMIMAAANEDELAAVLAHEIGHVSNRDGISAIKSARWTEAVTVMGTQAAGTYGSAQVSQLVGLFEGSVEDVFKSIVVNGYSRSQEYAADEAALRYSARSGYNPTALNDFLKRLAAKGKTSGGGIMQTHPATSDRLENIAGKAPSSPVDQRALQIRTSRFYKVSKQ